MLINYISSEAFIGRFIKELGLENTEYVDMIPQWIEDAVGIIGIPNYYIYKRALIPVKDSRAKIPCDIENLWGIFVAPNFHTTHDKGKLKRLFLQNSPFFGKGKGYETLGKEIGYGSINGQYVDTSFDKGFIYIAYQGIPLCDEGFPLVPKDPKFNEAVQYYFIYRMGLSGYKHPVITFSDAMQLWEAKYTGAGNSINWMDLQEYQDFTEMWTNPILGDLNANNYIT